jgi:hypothetical protein
MTDTNFEIKQGSEWSRTIILKDDTETVINLTGYTAKMQIRKFKSTTSLLYDDLTSSNGRITITPLAGQLVLNIPSNVSDLYRFTSAYYDLEIVDASSLVTRILEGKITINKNVTD